MDTTGTLFLIRSLQPSDLEAYYAMVQENRERLLQFFVGTTSRTKSLEDTKSFIAWMLAAKKEKQYYPYIITEQKSGNFLGFIDIKNIDWHLPKAEIGFYLDKAAEGKGLMRNVLNTFSDFCYEEHGFHKVFLRTHGSNIGAQKVAEHCGFTLEGTLREDYKTTDNQYIDLLYYGKLASDSTTRLWFDKVDNGHPDFIRMVSRLDLELAEIDGDEHGFYDLFNSIMDIKHCLVAYRGKQAVACGAFKPYNASTGEIKRMYTAPEMRGKGIAGKLLQRLENWASNLGYTRTVLETGKRQPEAIARYEKSGYQPIPNYGPYKGVENSVCFEKLIS